MCVVAENNCGALREQKMSARFAENFSLDYGILSLQIIAQQITFKIFFVDGHHPSRTT